MPGQRPSFTSASLWQTPHAVTLTRTVPGGGSGIGRSTISNSRFAAGICATRIVFIKPPRLLLHEREQVGVNGVGLSRGHAMRKALVGFQFAVLLQLCRQR